MSKVLFVKPIPDKKRVQIGVLVDEDKCTYTLTELTYKTLGCFSAGTEISSSDLDTLRFEDEYLRALKKASSYLSLSDKSKYELKMKLIRQGFSREASDIALERLCALGYLDEDRQLKRAVEREANYNLRGRYYIKRKLSAKGYSSSAISRAIDELVESGEIDFNSNLKSLIEKKGVTDLEERLALEYRYGYKI